MKPFAVIIAAGAFALAALTSAPAQAQLSETGGPVSYSADNLEYFDGEQRLVLTGEVDIVQNDARLRADRITLFFSGSTGAGAQAAGSQGGLGAGDIQRMIAEGDVYYVRPAQSARGNRAVYEVAQDAVTFSGNVVVASDENIIRGETLVLQIGSRRTTIRPSSDGRVRGVFVPRRGANQQNSGQSGR
jgi:lipopolysaccharide export system protein LptA